MDSIRSGGVFRASTLVRMPQFSELVLRDAGRLIDVHAAIPAEARFFGDMRHWTLTQMASAIHFEHLRDPLQPKLSPKSLHAAIGGAGVASRNTVQAYLRELERVQFCEKLSAGAQRQRWPQITRKFEDLVLLYLLIHLELLDALDGSNRAKALRSDRSIGKTLQPMFAWRLSRNEAWCRPPTMIRRFSDAASGSSILHDLMRSAFSDGPFHVSISGLAERYQVSRSHVSNLLKGATMCGAVTWQFPGRRGLCYVSQELVECYYHWQAEKLANLACSYADLCALQVETAA
ncbi:hypothetical protein [Salipiger sp. PrR003]|uniref:hypothetical protein n=1 Tax=Salipiger sp. PrR003 TaxID=2706776 RepID=UPI0013DCFF3E|nr:hypothetical protein [Salipiger sp. PrR003]NDV53030.1 hypothetical protein [Salipiger sp. PrR003]